MKLPRRARRVVIAYLQYTDAVMRPSGETDAARVQPIDPAGEQQLAWLLHKSKGQDRRGHHHLLLLRFALANMVALALLAVACVHGLVERAITADRTYLTLAIFAVFAAGLGASAYRVWQVSRDINLTKAFDPLVPSVASAYLAQLRGVKGESRSILASTLRMKLTQRVLAIRHLAGSLVLLGLIGTVTGFIIALSGVDPEQATNVKAISPMVSTLIQGMSTALYTTLVGAVLNVWLMMNFHILAGGTVRLITALVELGETHGEA